MSISHSAMHDATLSLLPDNSDQCVVSQRHFNEALSKVQPSVTNKASLNYQHNTTHLHYVITTLMTHNSLISQQIYFLVVVVIVAT